MAKARAAVAAIVVWTCSAASVLAAGTAERPVVVVRVYDYARISTEWLADIQRTVASVYARAGVELQWEEAAADIARPDGRIHVDVMVLDREMADRLDPARSSFGRAGSIHKRAYVYFERVDAYVQKFGGFTHRGLAFVMAHELGHTLLPVYSHSRDGLMKAKWRGPLWSVPDFTPAQAEVLRSLASRAQEPDCDLSE